MVYEFDELRLCSLIADVRTHFVEGGVSDILNGRPFAGRSVVKLMAKEQDVAEMANAFHYILEAMKNWDGKEIICLTFSEGRRRSAGNWQSLAQM